MASDADAAAPPLSEEMAVEVLSYTSVPAVKPSDHKPVVCRLQIALPNRADRPGGPPLLKEDPARGGCSLQ